MTFRISMMASAVILSLSVAGAAYAEGDAAAGKKVFNKCKACHALEAGKHKIGPCLHGIMGRAAGTVDGFTGFSKVMKNSGIVWDNETLAGYLENPKAYMKGTRMAFRGLRKAGEVENVLAYIVAETE